MPAINRLSERQKFVLAALAAGPEDEPYTPVQAQKLLFLVDENLAEDLHGRKLFRFKPYDYGPFDKRVYRELETLEEYRLLNTLVDGRLGQRCYSLTIKGHLAGCALLDEMAPNVKDYLQRLAAWVQEQSFAQLLGAIYEAYPEMAAKSVFRHQRA